MISQVTREKRGLLLVESYEGTGEKDTSSLQLPAFFNATFLVRYYAACPRAMMFSGDGAVNCCLPQ